MSSEPVDAVPTTQPRKKPIRTYGRRSSAAVVKADSKPSTPRPLSPEDTPAPQLPPPGSPETVSSSIECPKPNAPKSSILSYFKAKPKTTTAESKETTNKAATPAPTTTEEVVSTPPSPPPSSTGQRKRRRLTTRPTFDDEYDVENQDSKRRKEDGDETPVTEDGTPMETPSASQIETDSTSTGQSAAKKKRSTKTPTKEMVQTTLSLTIGDPKPGFIVCKECSMLYNHLNDKDRRDHKRVHAAYIRGRSRSRNKEDNNDT
ncbi:hypothetical protein B0T20DRAFT_149026 [Sordaria brevicollis]|uniref:N-acetyltransferase ESCO zinc-finger domain-containing protein n=1 Tax=Sordaria brevicollis TaxID=83679 RepID=A0AAE0UDZ7_SORBR|nr:hypothetical protein B0T20DRAFT_149026 [Sordaria brevicollis]